MHLHILGICGTFMGGIAAIAKAMGHKVTGSDNNVYPPMSTQLESLGIELTQGFDEDQFDPQPDMVVIGNALSRGNLAVEYVLNRGLPYTSGPQWLLENVLNDRWVLAVSGTHGKTSTSSMLAWILESAGMSPGFLIGGIPQNFGISARLGETPFFVIEADEYDSAFFDKRSKFVHYRPRTLVINNLEFDHADIFDSIADIQKQFHHLIRMIPGNGLVIAPKADTHITQVLDKGCWSPVQFVGSDWKVAECAADGSEFDVVYKGTSFGRVKWSLLGQHNVQNAMMAIIAARHAGVLPEVAIEALTNFVNAKRRMEVLGTVNGITVYDDFAHHPTAISTTLEGLRAKVGKARILAVLEPRSNTMKMGVHKQTLAQSWSAADQVFIYQPSHLSWSMDALLAQSEVTTSLHDDLEILEKSILSYAKPGDHILIMSNGGFGGIHQHLLQKLSQ
ncbi:UDP-N-acetylmuramate:L-alanyl-gamma-D-glutamyl-meso-diaminopimelate ligase [Paraglaciecola chathamensis]|jgi:UDP-N-acetylmuramate: L-alanyl-gamma-D-glutamyl-meso-diaminopimelate ligase|uniref:UDP-N-acetylmuramate--L-alanyl-gamma-D-glutamyl-meso-2,6-diaminoheptandioate ligase n=2 Tax=Paraglaciecola chathamensis TaxID=368405 RepID=A0A8H9ICV6_9ALTE|nr:MULTISPECIES: UDP-N-acetylmuramate:L-alanyl-gamma-D-glutamyl-meso-diaminopimelate ligase [Paraglaciecola]MBN27279.1 UDP-N-acetylmuramate:L-alanyl-gamma-D-glutamyl-meso-diaminopimelate ligase [Alteromonadaceae bacterium]MDO6560563.1 UDP-N-acetylmuramate:L-alanyl-gamma-D-glutamyl-meso-diaminopimelate ligase [Paraglaciecola chathamensis]MDO6839410.1 UDP-N-acetylmuramate:L-alanyl-gamma-D-glutamyl-meso-diaminopimelate ligase [Paraglaciecola chathamensis]GAC07997.1 UDP-N-acetylmuramate: L-alanyl-g|tara:strand:+ start:19491 stop:20837 length:1347 start_codon:yes stop_codon:yes gene_type:complete